MIVSTVVLSILAQATATTPAPARPAPARPAQITKAAVQAQVKAEFDRLDTNKDGFVDKAEAQKALNAMVAAREAQRQAQLNKIWARLDANKDGNVTRAEFDALLPKPTAPANNPYMTANDTNKDGRVALSEITARANADFDKVDTNRDGVLSGQEIQAARRNVQQQRQQRTGR